MNIICASSGIVDFLRPGQGISDIANAGFGEILLDLAVYCHQGELEDAGKPRRRLGADMQSTLRREERIPVPERPSELGGRAESLLEQCGKRGLCVSMAAAPRLGRDTKRQDLNGLLAQLALESIAFCGRSGCRRLIVYPLSAGVARGEEWRVNREFYLGLAAAARESGVMILLENQCRSVNGHLVRGVCAEAGEAAAWVDRLNAEAGEERFGFCMDVGVYNLCGQRLRETAVSLGSRVRAVRLRDCAEEENAMLPFTGVGRAQPKTDWLGLIRGLREIGFDGQLVLDFADTAACFSPLLRPQLMQLAKAVAEYFKWQIEIEGLLKKYSSIVLFGAGNMCRNYMKCYGEEYPPLFTCDNNRNLWGQEFCGLTVKSPECLRELPADCAIFICNVYYREIEGQLREMGIGNPIEFFNDEYMPSFHFDRIS